MRGTYLLKLFLTGFCCASILGATSDAPRKNTPVEPTLVTLPTKMLALPGKLDQIPVFNSNSPEVIQGEGILLSTCTKEGKLHPEAHLDYPLKGRFDIFFHHISNGVISGSDRTYYVGLIASNPSNHRRILHILAGSSYLSQPDASFIKLPPISENDSGFVYAGPGDRVMNDFLHTKHNPVWLRKIDVQEHTNAVIAALSIPIKGMKPPLNGRSGLLQMHSDGPIRLACIALPAKLDPEGNEHIPELSDWTKAIEEDALVGPREKPPSQPGTTDSVVYGRVAGVSIGSEWKGHLADDPKGKSVHLLTGQNVSFPISSLEKGTFGTGQIQSAPMAVRYPDTAYAAHGNYGVHYQLTIPVINDNDDECVTSIALQTPFKSDEKIDSITFFQAPATRVYFRGSVRVQYEDGGKKFDKYFHLVQDRGQMGSPLLRLRMTKGERRVIHFDLFYPPDATPPQVLTVSCASAPSSQSSDSF